MKKIFTWLFLLTKRTIKNPLLIILLVLMPFLAFAVNLLPSFHTNVSYEAGIYLDGEDEFSKQLCNALTESDGIFTFVEYDDLDRMYDDVKLNKINCGYIFPDDLIQRSELSQYNDCILAICQPGQTMQPAVNEFVYAELIKLQNYGIITNYVTSAGLFSSTDTDALEELIEYYEHYTKSDETFHILLKTYGTAGLSDKEYNTESISFPIRGILAIMVFLAGMFGSVTYMIDREKGIFQTLNNKYKMLCRILYAAIPAILFSISALITLKFSGIFISFAKEIPAMLLLIAITIVFCQFMIFITRKSGIYIAAIPGILIGCLIFCPVFIQASKYIPAASFIEKLFVPFYYLNLF